MIKTLFVIIIFFEVILDMDSHCNDAQYSPRALSKVRGVFVK